LNVPVGFSTEVAVTATPVPFEILQQNDITIFELKTAKLSDMQTIKLVGDALGKLAETPECQKLVVDLAKVQSMGSAALSQLVVVNRRMREKYGQVRVCSLQPAIAEVFRITHLNRALAIDETRGVSIASLSPAGAAQGGQTVVISETVTLGNLESLPTEEVPPPHRPPRGTGD
jgi:anti-anti-sigma factor